MTKYLDICNLTVGDWVNDGDEWRQLTLEDFEDLYNFEGIPIYNQILDLNRFEISSPNVYVFNNDDYKKSLNDPNFTGNSLHIKMEEDIGFYYLEIKTNNAYVIMNICYVHELQQALKLVGFVEFANKLKVEN